MYGLNTSLAIDSKDQPHIMYCHCQDWTAPGDLNYAVKRPEGWDVSTVATDGIRGRFPSMVLDDMDRPLVTWLDIDSEDVTRGFVRYGVLEDEGWMIETIDTLENIELGHSGGRKQVSIALDQDGVPHVAYGDKRVVKYATRTDGDWTRMTVLEASEDQYNGLVVLRLDPDENPGIVFWQPHPEEPGLVRLLASIPRPGDIDGDGDVDFTDFSILAGNFTGTLEPSTGGKTPEQGDFDGDGDVDFVDFSILSGNFTGTIEGAASELPLPEAGTTVNRVNVIPEPAAGGMLILGLLLAWRRRILAPN